MEIALGILTID